MTWRDDLRRVRFPDGRILIGASFRGVPFYVDSAERSGGRRIVSHEFPGREDNYVQDQGRQARVFSVEAYVCGDDYIRQRNALLDALEDESGPGELVHPFYGIRRAICSSLRLSESTSEGGLARLSIEFTEAPAQVVAVTEQADVTGVVTASAAAARSAVTEELESEYSIAGLPAHALESAARVLRVIADDLSSALAPIVRGTQEMARLNAKLRSITASAASLVRQPGEVAQRVIDALADLEETIAAAPGALVRAYLDTYAADIGPLAPTTTTTRQRELANQLALASALRRILVIEAAQLAPMVSWQTIDEAATTSDEIANLLEEQAAIAGDTAYPALVQLRADLLRAVPGDTLTTRIITISRSVAVPSLVLAYQLYGSVDAEPDILARNPARHPGFLAGELKVLSDV